jgi:release factor glutamine methyltransferase
VTRQEALREAARLLSAAGVPESSFESELLLRYVLQVDRAAFFQDLEQELNLKTDRAFRELILRRVHGEPNAYITRHKEFYGLEFYVDPRVIIPRPETELLVDTAISYIGYHPVSLAADIGTGSGCIAITLALKIPEIKVLATDISAGALEVARMNSLSHGVAERIVLLQGDMLSPLTGPVDLILSNMPYIKKNELREIASARYEPELALDGGESGLDKVFALCREVQSKLRPGGGLILEVGMGQAPAVKEFLNGLFPLSPVSVFRDLAGIERVVQMSLRD